MNKATCVQCFTYLGLVVSEKKFLKLTNLTLWGYGLQSPLKAWRSRWAGHVAEWKKVGVLSKF